jgi:hypothetical protein
MTFSHFISRIVDAKSDLVANFWQFDAPDFGFVIVTHIALFIPIFLIWFIYILDLGKNVGIKYFLADMPIHYNREYDEKTQTFEPYGKFTWRLVRDSPTLWTHFYLSIYICLTWLIATKLNFTYEFYLIKGGVISASNPVVSGGIVVFLIISLGFFASDLYLSRYKTGRSARSAWWEFGRALLGTAIGGLLVWVAMVFNIVGRTAKFIKTSLPDIHRWEAEHFAQAFFVVVGIYLVIYFVLLVIITVLNKLRPIAVPYLFFVFFVFMFLYSAFAALPDQYDLIATAFFVAYLALVWVIRLRIRRKHLRFEGVTTNMFVDRHNKPIDAYALSMEKRKLVEAEASIPNENLLEIDTVLNNWLLQAQKEQGTKKPKMILMGTSGGAALAGYWTTLVGDALASSKMAGGFQALRMITGASGGMVGASYLAGMAPRINATKQGETPPSISGRMDSDSELPLGTKLNRNPIKRDLLTQVFAQLINFDLMGILLPWVPHCQDHDRGKTLDRQFYNLGMTESSYDKTPSFSDFRAAEEAGLRPSLLFSPMMLESGAPLLISNMNVKSIIDEKYGQVKDSVAMFDLYKGSEDTFPVVTAARMSATFPYVSPGVGLPTTVSRRVVDAGYYENYGINLICQFLLNEEVRAWLLKKTSGVAIMELRAFPQQQGKQASPMKQVFHFLTGPIEGMLAARGSSMLLRNTQFLRVAQRVYDAPFWKRQGQGRAADELIAMRSNRVDENQGFIRSYEFVNRVPGLPLNWYLPENAYSRLFQQVSRNPKSRAALKQIPGLEPDVEFASDVIKRMEDDWGKDWSK